MTNPTMLVSNFTADLSAHDQSGATAWIEATSSAVSFSDDQMHMETGDAVWIQPLLHLDSSKGSLSLHYTRESDTGDTEFIIECGQDGDDWLRLYVDGTTGKLVLWWASGGALPQTLESTVTIALDTPYLIICGWQHTATSLAVGVVGTDGIVDSVATATGVRDVPVGQWGAGRKLVLLAGDPTGVYGYGAYGDGPYGE